MRNAENNVMIICCFSNQCGNVSLSQSVSSVGLETLQRLRSMLGFKVKAHGWKHIASHCGLACK